MSLKGRKMDGSGKSGGEATSEDRMYLYSKSGSERIAELEEKREAYKTLDFALETLPRKLEHPGLIPLGPGLFAHGSLVRTNEVLVLLGDSYFAERTAYQAREIVQRRLEVIESKLSEVEVGKSEVEAALQGNLELKQNTEQSSARENDICSRKGGSPAVEANDVRKPGSPRPDSGIGGKGRGDRQDAAGGKKKKRVSFAEGTKGGSSERQESGETARSTVHSVREMLADFDESVKQAERHCKESGTVNIVEEYDANGVLKGVQVPEENRPENVIVTAADEVEELFDMTRPRKEGSEYTRKDYLKALLISEREEELRLEREAAEQAERVRKKEAREFGGGFAKGFLGKKEKSAKKDGVGWNKGLKEDVQQSTEVAERVVHAEDVDGMNEGGEENEGPVGRDALENSVLERSSGTRRRRRGAGAQKKARAPVPNLAKVNEDNSNEEGGLGPEQPRTRVSKFKQMRSLQQK